MGSELTLTVSVTRVYPVPVRVACFYEDDARLTADQEKLAFAERAAKIGETVLAPAVDRDPTDKEVLVEKLTFRFSVPEPGDYFLACLTPAAADNGLGLSFEIR